MRKRNDVIKKVTFLFEDGHTREVSGVEFHESIRDSIKQIYNKDNLEVTFRFVEVTKDDVDIDFTDGNYVDLEKLYKDILIDPEKITSDIEVKQFIIENRKLVKPIYEQQFTLTVLESNGVEILKSILNEINKQYKLKIISSPLYAIEFENLDLHQEIKDKLEKSIENIECIFEITEFNISKELEIDF